MRELKELYELLLKRVEESNFQYGICEDIRYLFVCGKIGPIERYALRDSFTELRFGKWSRFYWNSASNSIDSAYWWKTNIKGKQQRIRFIKHIIKKL